jgi:choice-of-anchor A domain-containing protein
MGSFRLDRIHMRSCSPIGAPCLVFLAAFAIPQAHADLLPLGAAGNYAVLYEGNGGHNLQIANVTIVGNIGVGGTGVVQDNGPSTITGSADFASTTAHFNNNNVMNSGPTSVNANVAAVTSALNTINSLSSSLAGLGANLAISGTQTINESAGQLDTVNGTTYSIFNITSYSETDGNFVTINGDGSGDPVVFNFAGSLGNVNLKGLVKLSGLTDDQVLWNFTSSGKNVNLNTNDSSYPNSAFHGVILAPNDVLSMNAAALDGRIFGGDSSDMQIVSHNILDAPEGTVPEPSSSILLVTLVVGLFVFGRSRRSLVLPPQAN